MAFRSRSRTARKAALLAALTALSLGALSAPAEASSSTLPKLDITGVYVTGVSSGGFLATQLQVAYSATFDGAGIFAAGPYDCGQGNVVEFETCDLGIGVTGLEQQAKTWAAQGKIDPVADLAGKPVFTFHGTLDPIVNTLISDSGVSLYQSFSANVDYDNTDPAGHSWVTPDGVVPCSLTSAPFLNNCGDDPEGRMLADWFGHVNAPNSGTPEGTLSHFNQNAYVPGSYALALSMDTTGMLYTPPSCAAGQPCKLVVALHGCLSGQYLIGDEFAELGNLDTYADTNNLEILYPQAISSVLPYNPEGCWDWFGYTGSNYAVKTAPQMTAIVNMVHSLGG